MLQIGFGNTSCFRILSKYVTYGSSCESQIEGQILSRCWRDGGYLMELRLQIARVHYHAPEAKHIGAQLNSKQMFPGRQLRSQTCKGSFDANISLQQQLPMQQQHQFCSKPQLIINTNAIHLDQRIWFFLPIRRPLVKSYRLSFFSSTNGGLARVCVGLGFSRNHSELGSLSLQRLVPLTKRPELKTCLGKCIGFHNCQKMS